MNDIKTQKTGNILPTLIRLQLLLATRKLYTEIKTHKKHLIMYLSTANILIGDYNKYPHMKQKTTPLSINVQFANYKR